MGDPDNPPMPDELSKATGILPEIIRVDKQTALFNHLHDLLCLCGEEGSVL